MARSPGTQTTVREPEKWNQSMVFLFFSMPPHGALSRAKCEGRTKNVLPVPSTRVGHNRTVYGASSRWPTHCFLALFSACARLHPRARDDVLSAFFLSISPNSPASLRIVASNTSQTLQNARRVSHPRCTHRALACSRAPCGLWDACTLPARRTLRCKSLGATCKCTMQPTPLHCSRHDGLRRQRPTGPSLLRLQRR